MPHVARLGATSTSITANSYPRSLVTAGDNATTKNPFADTPNTNPSDPATTGVSKPLAVTPDIHKPASIPAATTNGGDAAAPVASTAAASHGNGVNGSGPKLESLVPEQSEPAAPPAATEASATSIPDASAPSGSSTSAQPPVMTGALPSEGQSNSIAPVPKEAESTEKDGVEDIIGGGAATKPTTLAQTDEVKGDSAGSTTTPAGAVATEPSSAPKPNDLNGEKKDSAIDTSTSIVLDEKKDSEKPAFTEEPKATAPAADPVEQKDVEMKDAAPIPAAEKPSAPAPTPVPATAPVTDTTGLASTTGAPTTTPALATPSTAVTEATGGKRKAPADEVEAAAPEPAAKKQKGAFSRAMDKAKEAVKDVKEKAKPGRKPGKREKKEIAPVGRTERKTRSQARAE